MRQLGSFHFLLNLLKSPLHLPTKEKSHCTQQCKLSANQRIDRKSPSQKYVL